MGEFCEFEIDFGQFDDLTAVVVHDECGDHEDVWFYRLDGLKAENKKLRELMSEGSEVENALLRYRDNPPVKHAGPIEGTWYETGEILSIIMDKPDFSTGELLTRLAYLMGVRERRTHDELGIEVK